MKPIWKPLEEKLGPELCVGFMYMGRVNGINLYKHGLARLYLNLDDRGRCYVRHGASGYKNADFSKELSKLIVTLTMLGETLESVYDDAYISRKRAALLRAGISLIRFEIEPEIVSVN
jgi:hypothetical protein